MAVDRKPLRKAPIRDVVDAFTTPPPATADQPSAAPDVAAPNAPVSQPRGPGRPRSKIRMEQFSSKMAFELRDEMDAYVLEHDMTVVEFLDGAIRDRLKK